MGKTRDLFKKIRDIKGTFHAKMGLMKDRNGMYLTEAEDIKKRWQEYTEELYKKDLHDQDNHDGEIICNRTETQYNYVSTALGLPVLAKPLTLYVTEKDKVAMGVLSQTMGTWDRLVAYPPKLLGSVATGWLGCLRTVVVVVLLVQEATKVTLGQDVKVPHEVNTLLRGEPHKWLSTSRITQYQGLLCENPHVTIEPCQALNPATLLPLGEGGPSHDCKEICQQT